MLALERHRKIVEIIEQKESMRVIELARLFQVTEETIRRDLEKLETQGKLLRSHGGAISVRNKEKETPFIQRKISYEKEKMSIAKEAVKQIKEGDTIILDASTTAWQMSRLIPNMKITVVTNAIKVALELADRSQITLISTGGTLIPESLSYVGPLAEKSLRDYHVNKLFISCKGLNFKTGLSEPSEFQAMIKKRMISIADYCYLLIDHSKFEVQALSNFAQIIDINQVITDTKVDESHIKTFKKFRIPVKVADKELTIV